MTTQTNKRASGKGGFARQFHIERAWPALPEHERWMNARIPVLLAILVATMSLGCRKSTQLSGGMAPTITNNEQVSINYLAYAGSSPRRWDVVALLGPPPMLPSNSMFLKRVTSALTKTKR